MGDNVKAHQPKPHLVLGTSVRHKTSGYEGKIDGTTAIKGCFTSRGAPLFKSHEQFQYRIAVAGEATRRIAPAEDLEIVEQKVPSPVSVTKQKQNRQVPVKRKRKQVRHFD